MPVQFQFGDTQLNNPALYNAVIVGFNAGYAQSRYPTTQQSGAYGTLEEVAVLVATSVDALVETDGSLTQSDVSLMAGIVAGAMAGRHSPLQSADDFATFAEGIVTLYTAGYAVLDPDGDVGGGGGPWQQLGGVGSVIDTVDETAAVSWAGGVAEGYLSTAGSGGNANFNFDVAFGVGATADSTGSNPENAGAFATSGSSALRSGAVAMAGGIAEGSYSTALNRASAAAGCDFAVGPGSVAQNGDDPDAFEGIAVAIGYSSTAFGNNTFAFGFNASSAGDDSYAIGVESNASASGSNGDYAFGAFAQADGGSAYAFGRSTTASAFQSYAFAGGTSAADGAVSFGTNTIETQENSYKIGDDVTNNSFLWLNYDGNAGVQIACGPIDSASGSLFLQGVLTATTIGAAGGASALPVTPLGYLEITLDSGSVRIPYYNP